MKRYVICVLVIAIGLLGIGTVYAGTRGVRPVAQSEPTLFYFRSASFEDGSGTVYCDAGEMAISGGAKPETWGIWSLYPVGQPPNGWHADWQVGPGVVYATCYKP